MTEPFTFPKIAQVGINCNDLERAKAFYCGALGLPLVGEFGDSMFVRCGEVNLIIQQSENPRVPGSMIYFGADGCVDEATAALKSQGIVFKQEPRRIARNHEGVDVWLGFFDDPWGNPLGLISNMPVAA
jgi:catechol 2,3-dioxygenase-like lactoylglutathione lyase family enzyme